MSMYGTYDFRGRLGEKGGEERCLASVESLYLLMAGAGCFPGSLTISEVCGLKLCHDVSSTSSLVAPGWLRRSLNRPLTNFTPRSTVRASAYRIVLKVRETYYREQTLVLVRKTKEERVDING
ncbi:hypothetical protein E4T56_gene7281 [Termitomyces sp. T112]|nr:hypothetical protein E4T56_gene7281 [Termitomyces sp. T112]